MHVEMGQGEIALNWKKGDVNSSTIRMKVSAMDATDCASLSDGKVPH